MSSIITFTTDFGLRDGYVAAMKGALLSINPNVTIVDVSHSVSPRNVREGSFVLGSAYRYYPGGTIHVAVIDPGVGTSRRPLLLRGGGFYFIGPDNGVLSYVLADALQGGSCTQAKQKVSSKPDHQALPKGFEGIVLTNRRYWRPEISATFHGRDIFAPVAAHLSLGVPLEELGEPIYSVVAFAVPLPKAASDGAIHGEIVHIDQYGNLVTNIAAGDLPGGGLEIEVKGCKIKGVSGSYEEAGGLLGIIGSGGHLEISQKNGSAASLTMARIGAPVFVRRLS